MKRFILITCLCFVCSLVTTRAADANFISENRESDVAAEMSVTGSANRSPDSDQNHGILSDQAILRLDSRYGDVAVETIFGRVNGLQLHVTW